MTGLDRRKLRQGAAVVAAALALGGSYAALAPRWYRASATLVPTAPSKGVPGAIASLMPELAEGSVEVERIVAALESNAVTDGVVRKLSLLQVWGLAHVERARTRLWQRCWLKLDRRARTVSLTCEEHDPQLAQQIVAAFSELANDALRRVGRAADSEEVRFLEQRASEMRAEADAAALRVRDFEQRHRIVDLDSQSKAVVNTLAGLYGQQISKELQLSFMGNFTARGDESSVQLRREVAAMDSRVRALIEAGKPDSSRATEPGVLPAALAVPQLRYELAQLERDRRLYEASLAALMQRLEMAKVNVARDTSTLQVLDPPVLATSAARPQLLVVFVVALALGLVAAAAWIATGEAAVASLRRLSSS
ncbi:MAG TPA: hypothetical protein VFL36_24105 [Myxococcales bacterium]|nr:hypothetical protein [Myxococcales bacterium]